MKIILSDSKTDCREKIGKVKYPENFPVSSFLKKNSGLDVRRDGGGWRGAWVA